MGRKKKEPVARDHLLPHPPLFSLIKREKRNTVRPSLFSAFFFLPFRLHGQTHNSKITSLLLPVRSVPYGQPERKRGPFSPLILAFLVLSPLFLKAGEATNNGGGVRGRRQKGRRESRGGKKDQAVRRLLSRVETCVSKGTRTRYTHGQGGGRGGDSPP